MTDAADENHDGSTQPLPVDGGNEADTVPFDHVPIAEPPTVPGLATAAPVTMPARTPNWAPWSLVAVLALALLIGAAVLLPPLLSPVAVASPSPSPTAPTSSATPTLSDDGGVVPAPADPEPTVAPPPDPTPEPTVDPPDPTPEPAP